MPRRSKDWNAGLAEDLRHPEFAREFHLAAIDEGVPLQVALGKAIRAMGVKEFAAKTRMASPNVLRGTTGGSGEEQGGCALVQAKVYDTKGNLVDGVLVQFTTTLCCFAGPDEVNIVGTAVNTLRGNATVTFWAKKERGTATITAAVEDAFDTVLITVF
jgi:hypothetical protein